MKQIIQDLKSGETLLVEVPAPVVQPGHVLIRTDYTLVSRGTERMLVDFGRAGWIDKARQQPDKVKQVLQKIKTDGLKPTVETVLRKLNQPIPLGYCNAGTVIAVGSGVDHIQAGDRVASNGAHAGIVLVPKNLVAKIPEGVSRQEGAFAVIGAIALQGIRLIKPELGETVVVTGLGLIGLIAGQLLLAHGCRVIGIEPDAAKRKIAEQYGIESIDPASIDVVRTVLEKTHFGADAVLITASAKGNTIISQAAQMSRKRGRIILTGVIGLDINRADFYEKELRFQVSCSYGPGRYDPEYEEKGRDYPIGFVRWTEQRNIESVLRSMSTGGLDVKPLISEVKDIEDYGEVYSTLDARDKIASLLKYSGHAVSEAKCVSYSSHPIVSKNGGIGIIGAGNYTDAMILPVLSKLKADICGICSARGLSASQLAKKYRIPMALTDASELLSMPDIEGLIIATRHDMHASMVVEALQRKKHVFVEKPLAINMEEIEQIEDLLKSTNNTLTVGFNRRFSPHSRAAKALIGESGDVNIVATMNAGFIPADHWVQDPAIGGGRIIGEACHLIDLLVYLTGSNVRSVMMNTLNPGSPSSIDNASILLQFENGANGTVHYFANGNKSYPKERIEIHTAGKSIIIDNFRRSNYYGYKKSGLKTRLDKGQHTMFEGLLKYWTQGGSPLISPDEIFNVSRASILALESAKKGCWVEV